MSSELVTLSSCWQVFFVVNLKVIEVMNFKFLFRFLTTRLFSSPSKGRHHHSQNPYSIGFPSTQPKQQLAIPLFPPNKSQLLSPSCMMTRLYKLVLSLLEEMECAVMGIHEILTSRPKTCQVVTCVLQPRAHLFTFFDCYSHILASGT